MVGRRCAGPTLRLICFDNLANRLDRTFVIAARSGGR